MVFDYLDAGADDEITIRRNKDAYSQLELHYHILAGLKPPLNMGTRIMGRDVDIPFFPSPTAGSKMFHADGEVGVARAAAGRGDFFCLFHKPLPPQLSSPILIHSLSASTRFFTGTLRPLPFVHEPPTSHPTA